MSLAGPASEEKPYALPPGGDEDKRLTLAFQRGEKGSYQAIHDAYQQRVYNVCRRMLVKPEDAQEAAQEAFLRVYQALGYFNGRYQLGPWITRIATNVCLDHLRARARRPSDASLELLEIEPDHAHDNDPESVTIRRSESRRVRRVLQNLPPMHRAAIVLREFEGMSYQEIACILDISDAQVKALLHRARQRFKRDWTGSVAALLPWRLIQRMRSGEHLGRDSAMYGSAAQVAPACSTAVQQCGQYMIDKLAPVLTAALVTTTAAAPLVPAVSHAIDSSPTVDRPALDGDVDRTTARERSATSTNAAGQIVSDSSQSEPVEPPAPTTTPTPSPTPTPTSAPAGTPGGGSGTTNQGGTGGTGTPTASPTPTPTPDGPFAPAVGFDWGRPVKGRTPTSHEFWAECDALSIEQRLETMIEDDDSPAWYPAILTLDGDSRLYLTLAVDKSGGRVFYVGRSSSVSLRSANGRLDVSYSGTYDTSSGNPSNVDLPPRGRFDAALTLDCATHSVITESVVFRS